MARLGKTSLSKITRDLTQAAREGQLAPAFGMDKMLFDALQVLMRKDRKNLLLVGEPGVGKEKFGHGLAWAGIQGGETANDLFNYSVLELDLPTVVSSTPDAEGGVVQSLLHFLKASPHVILFVNGIGPALNEKAEEPWAAQIAEILGGAIRRAEVTCVGTLTPGAYEALTAQDASLADDFEVIRVNPRSREQTLELLDQLRPHLEEQHDVGVGMRALNAAIAFTEEFMPDKCLPGKAVEVLDQACARYKLKVAAKQNFPDMVEEASFRQLGREVGPHDVMRVVARNTKADVEASAKKWKTKLAQRLLQDVPGQNDAIVRLANSLIQLRMGFAEPYGPAGVLLFCGPQGGGKVQTAEALSRTLGGASGRAPVLDMVDYADEGAGERLLSPGAEGGLLSMAVPAGKAPFSTAVLAHADKAHGSVFDALLPIWKTGALEGEGTAPVSFRRCLFVITYDLVVEGADQQGYMKQLRHALLQQMKPEMPQLVYSVVFFTGPAA